MVALQELFVPMKMFELGVGASATEGLICGSSADASKSLGGKPIALYLGVNSAHPCQYGFVVQRGPWQVEMYSVLTCTVDGSLATWSAASRYVCI